MLKITLFPIPSLSKDKLRDKVGIFIVILVQENSVSIIFLLAILAIIAIF